MSFVWRGRCVALTLTVLFLAAVCPGAAAAASEGHGIETMVGADWKGMWGFEKRGFAECWLAGKRHQAGRTLSELKRLEPQLGAAATNLKAMQAEFKAVLECRVTPKQLEEAVNRFYDSPGNARVLLGDALHHVVLEHCGAARPRPPAGAR